jgi:uncharacterized protein (TIGR03086 family)
MSTLASGRALDLLDRALAYTRGSLHTAAHTDLSTPTPCAAWDLRALLEHLDDSLAALTEAAAGRVRPAPPAAGLPDDLLLVAVSQRATAALGAWSGRSSRADVVLEPDAALAEEVVASVGALEIAVHGWDVARACRADRPLPEALAHDLQPVAFVAVTDADRPGRFATPVPTDLPSAGARLLAFLGRSPA